MPPNWDVYTWLSERDPAVLSAFIARYVNVAAPGDTRLEAFVRTYVAGTPDDGDLEALSDLGIDDSGQFTLYVRGLEHPG
ncbi:hypothetical protein ACFQX7_00325 [Luedemannella flava]